MCLLPSNTWACKIAKTNSVTSALAVLLRNLSPVPRSQIGLLPSTINFADAPLGYRKPYFRCRTAGQADVFANLFVYTNDLRPERMLDYLNLRSPTGVNDGRDMECR